MKIGLNLYSLARVIKAGDMDAAECVRWIAENGGEHVEVSSAAGLPLETDPAVVREITKAARESGLVVSSYTIGANLAPRPDAELRAEIDRVKRNVDIAAQLGVSRMRHDVVSRPREESTLTLFEKDLPTAVDACREIADYAARLGITTSLENHGYHFQGSDRVLRFLTAVDRPNFRLTLDVGNFLCADENPLDAVRRLARYASMVHFKDFYVRRHDRPMGEGWFPSRSGNNLRGAILGHGDVDIPAVFEIVRASGYEGFVSVEFEGMEDCRLGSRLGMETLHRLRDGAGRTGR